MLEPRPLLALNLRSPEQWGKIWAAELDGCIQIFALLLTRHASYSMLLYLSFLICKTKAMIPTYSGCQEDNL